MKWKIEGPFDTNERHGWVPQVFGNVVVFRVGRGLFAWDLTKNEKIWSKELPEDEAYGNKQSTKCGGYYVTFSDIASRHKPEPIFAIDPQTGKTIWKTLVEAHCGGFEKGLTASHQSIFFHGYYEPDKQYNFIKLDPQTGEIIWKQPGQFAKQVVWRDDHLFLEVGLD